MLKVTNTALLVIQLAPLMFVSCVLPSGKVASKVASLIPIRCLKFHAFLHIKTMQFEQYMHI